jgi:hypothetical protein
VIIGALTNGKKARLYHGTAHLFILSELAVDFEGGEITSDAGPLLIRQADNSAFRRIARCVEDHRDSRYADHSMVELLWRRIYQEVAGMRTVTTGLCSHIYGGTRSGSRSGLSWTSMAPMILHTAISSCHSYMITMSRHVPSPGDLHADTGKLITTVLRACYPHASYGAAAVLERIVPKLR